MAREFRTSPDFKTAVLANGSAGTNGQVLTSAGAGAPPSWTTVGGGLTKFTDAESTASPNATVYVDSLTAAAASTNADVALVAKGSGATLAQVPDGTSAGGNKRGARATDLQKSRSAAIQVASGGYAVICGGGQNEASLDYSAAISGYGNAARGFWACIVGGYGNFSNNTFAAIVGGSSNTASGRASFVGCGESNTADGSYSFIGGGRAGTTRSIAGCHVFPACNVPIANIAGVTQSALLLLGRETTDATATVLTSNTSAASTTNQVILPNNAAYSFSGEVIAGVTGAGNTARWTISGAIKRGASAATTAMVGTPTVAMTHNDAGASAWVVNVTADTTNGGIKVEVTGAASTTIRWVCRINTVEVTY